MDVKNPLPVFAAPPADYDRRYFNDLIRSLNQMTVLIRTAGEGRQSTMVFTNLPSNDYGLEAGSVFQDEGVLRVSLLNEARVLSVSSEVQIEEVTVQTVDGV